MGRPITKDIPKREYNNSETPAFSGKYSCGLTKREYFAGLAMRSLFSNTALHLHTTIPETRTVLIEQNIKVCIQIADELLKQLEK